jgi:ribosome biogenesis GTP-binding protein YsxC/EngB
MKGCRSARFFGAASQIDSFPPVEGSIPEVAFAGRSNVGKSSLLNSLLDKPLARTSSKPGLTQSINWFRMPRMSVVDLPGYGFAFVDEEDKISWTKLIYDYIFYRRNLKRLFLLIDSRHGLKDFDREFLRKTKG